MDYTVEFQASRNGDGALLIVGVVKIGSLV